MTLTSAPIGTALVLTSSGLDATTDRQLRALGIRPGARLSLVRRLPGGMGIVSVEGARVVMDAALMSGLTVEPA